MGGMIETWNERRKELGLASSSIIEIGKPASGLFPDELELRLLDHCHDHHTFGFFACIAWS